MAQEMQLVPTNGPERVIVAYFPPLSLPLNNWTGNR